MNDETIDEKLVVIQLSINSLVCNSKFSELISRFKNNVCCDMGEFKM